jgi:hypothetical protein
MGGEVEGNRGWDDNTVEHVLNTCAQNLHGTHYSRNFRGVAVGAGCVYSSRSFEPFEVVYRKLLGEVDAEFVRNSKVLVDFEVRT